jgi:hypothetical protein
MTPEESQQLVQLAEAIFDYGRMIQEHLGSSLPFAIVEIEELARRFREPARTIKDALMLLRETGRAEPASSSGVWKLKLANTRGGSRQDAGAA